MKSHRLDETDIRLIEEDSEIKKLHECERTVKLFYREHYKYNCYSRNWGDSKGEDRFGDVLVVLNKNTFGKFREHNLSELKPQTRNKLYVACTRARGNLYFASEELYKRSLVNLNPN